VRHELSGQTHERHLSRPSGRSIPVASIAQEARRKAGFLAILVAMREVSAATAMLLYDALDARGLAPDRLWHDLAVSHASLAGKGVRIDWETWVEMAERAQTACGGPREISNIFVPGSGSRAGHPFVRLAHTFLKLTDVYGLLARWGVSRSIQVARGRFESHAGGKATFTLTIDAQRAGSLPTLRFVVGMLRSIPVLHGLGAARVELDSTSTAHHGSYQLELPKERSLLASAHHVVRVATGVRATVDELARQSAEISEQNAELRRQLGKLEVQAAALRERDASLTLAMEAGQLGVWSCDLVRRGVHCTQGIARMLGLPADQESTTDEWMACIHPDDRPLMAASVARALTGEAPLDLEHRCFDPTGGIIWVHSKGEVMRDAEGRPLRIVGTGANITERKRCETKLRLADRLISAGTLAAGVAHEVNNPLAAVMANLELLRGSVVGADGESRLGDMSEGLIRIRDIIRDLQSFARPEEDAATVLDIRKVCDATVRLVSSLVRRRATLEVDYAPDTPPVMGNESRFGQVMTNLIINAEHALPDRPIEQNLIRIRTRRSGGETVIEVEDNGLGIATEVLPHIFDPFFTTKGFRHGSGLGLSVCQSIVTALGGQIEVDTELGRGSTFRLRLPSVATPEQRPAPARAVSGAAALRVLLIDDEPLVRRAVASLLRGTATDLTVAKSATHGLELLASQPFDAILCDVTMPDLSGIDVRAALLRDRPQLVPRMVFISGGAVHASARRLLDEPDIRLLKKPFDRIQLLDALEAVARHALGHEVVTALAAAPARASDWILRDCASGQPPAGGST